MIRKSFRPSCALILTSAILSWFLIPRPICADTPAPIAESKLLEPKPILEGDKVVTLYPPGHPALKNLAGYDKPENFNMSKGANPHVLNITNIHNPSIELQLPPAEKANGTAMIVAAGGGNTTLWVGPEGADIGKWLNGLGVAAFNLRYRLKPYDSAVDALADTQRAIRTVRAHAKEWGVDPKKIGIMGFSAGGEQAARAALNFDEGKPDATDPIDRESSRPDFAVLVYAGWRQVDLSNVPKNAPPPSACAPAWTTPSMPKRRSVSTTRISTPRFRSSCTFTPTADTAAASAPATASPSARGRAGSSSGQPISGCCRRARRRPR